MKNILFISLGDFSNINSHLELQIKKNFPDHALDTLVLKSKLKKNIIVLFFCVLAIVKEYFFDFVTGRKNIFKIRNYFNQTPFIMRHYKREIEKQLEKKKYSFVFQTQSVFDSSNYYAPNFIYIDHTNLNNLNYKYIDPQQYLGSPRFIKLESNIYSNATLLFVMSTNILNSLVQQYGINSDKIKLVYAGSNTITTDTVDGTKYANKNILFVGKDWERKGGPLLVEAFKIVLKSIPDATLTIVGCKPTVNVKNCLIVGEIPLNQVAEYYNKASVFCLPSRREPFGIVFVEAMINHLAVVTNTVGATPDLIINNENGFRLEFNADDYAEALISLLNDPEKCEQFGNRSYQLANQTYRWDNVGNLIYKHISTELNYQDM